MLGNKLVKSNSKKNGREIKIVKSSRVNFKFNQEKYQEYRKLYKMNTCTIVRTNEKFFNLMEGSVVPKQFWPNAEEFCKYGAGYSILYEGKLASTAYSAFIHGNKLELGIETNEKFRGKGLANQCCSVLIDYCLDNGFEPVWACQKDNIGSFKLALKLGFEPIACQPYYGLFLERNSQLLKI